MHFDVANVQWVIVGIPHYPSEDAGLVTLVWSRDTVSLTAMIRGRANNDPENRIIVGLCVFKALEDNRSNCIGSAVPIGAVVEGVTIPYSPARVSHISCPVDGSIVRMLKKLTGCGQEVSAVQASEVVWVGENIGSTCYRSIAFSPPKISARGLHGGEAGGAGSIHTDAWPGETKEITLFSSVKTWEKDRSLKILT